MGAGAGHAKPASAPALEIQQLHPLGGPQRLVIAKNAVRIEHPNSGVVVVSRAPFDDVTLMNPKTKRFMNLTIDRAIKKMKGLEIVVFTINEFSEQNWKGPQETVFDGRKALLYTKKTPGKSWCKYWVLKEPKLPPQVLSLIAAYSGGLSGDYGIPLKMQQLVTAADDYNSLDHSKPSTESTPFMTKSVREVTVPDSTFTCPTDYKLADGNSDVMKGTVGFGSFKELVQSPDFLFQSSSKKLQLQKEQKETQPQSKQQPQPQRQPQRQRQPKSKSESK